jgi:hypothetical protein
MTSNFFSPPTFADLIFLANVLEGENLSKKILKVFEGTFFG